MNPIELQAQVSGYFDKFMPEYPKLHTRFEELDLAHKVDPDTRNFWSAFRKVKYFVFDVLYHTHRSINCNCPDWSPLLVLTRFEETYVNVISVGEDLKTLMALLEFKDHKLTHDLFLMTLGSREWEQLKDPTYKKNVLANRYIENQLERFELTDKLRQILYLQKDINPSVESRQQWELRHLFVHRFRPLWWKHEQTQEFGFPRRALTEANGLSEESWEMIVDGATWEKKVSNLSDDDFISAKQLLQTVHYERAKVADHLFAATFKKLKAAI